MHILFMGTPEYARIILQGLVEQTDHTVRVVTKPDAPQGRHRVLTASPVAQYACSHEMVVDKPRKLLEYRETWQAFQPDLIITAAYGRILRPWLLNLPHYGSVNLHASLLPRWRGANPIAWAIRCGDTQTGVTLMQMDEGMDTGPIIAQKSLPIDPEDTTGTLTEKLAISARDLLLDHLTDLDQSQWNTVKQSDQGMTLAPKFEPKDEWISWQEPAYAIDCRLRSLWPHVLARTSIEGTDGIVHIGAAQIVSRAPDKIFPSAQIGDTVLVGDVWHVQTGSGILALTRIRPAGRGMMSPGAFMRGHQTLTKVRLV
ncbi:MAG: methionyl-tRNA formyltransferase [Firmicutes bacterium]|nr:methionyl-tRNA formyltransferase [Bacillota bacterium]